MNPMQQIKTGEKQSYQLLNCAAQSNLSFQGSMAPKIQQAGCVEVEGTNFIPHRGKQVKSG